MRSAPILTKEQLEELWSTAPADAEGALRSEDEEAGAQSMGDGAP